MPDGKGPVTTRRRLRVELNKMREQAGLSQAAVVAKVDWSISKLIRIENGSVGISVTDLRALLGIYQASPETIDDLVALARVARERRWWSGYRDTLSPSYQEFIGFEDEAVRLRQFHPTIVPGLLQTEAYVRAITEPLALTPVPAPQAEKFVQIRLRRQSEVLNGEHPPEFTVIIDEGALRRPAGGIDAMRLQLQHLVNIQKQNTAAIAVLPFAAGPHIGMLGAFHIMDFADEADDSVLYLENSKQGDVALKDKEDVAVYGRHFEALLAMSLRGTDAIDILTRIADHIDSD